MLRTVGVAGTGWRVEDLPPSLPVLYAPDRAWRLLAERAEEDGRPWQVLLRYAPGRVLLSGWLAGGERIQGAAARLRFGHGAGSVQRLGFRLQYRSRSMAAGEVVLRALFLEPQAPWARP